MFRGAPDRLDARMLPVGREPIVADTTTSVLGEPQLVNQTTARNACIATAIALVALVAASPIAAAEEPTVEDDGSVQSGDCAGVNPWSAPPSWWISIEDCIGEA